MSSRPRTNRRQFLAYGGALAAVPFVNLPPAAPQAEQPGERKLPDLPYAYDALEPYVDEQTMRLHHDKHHGGAVRGLNRTELALAAMCKSGSFADTRKLCRDLAYYGSSHMLHSVFWTNMKAGGGGAPKGDLASRLKHDFGSLDAFHNLFLTATNSAPASGWGMLAWHAGLGRCIVLQVADHEKLTVWGTTPLLVCDVWEHAYYLKYQNRRADWTSTFVEKLIDWDNVAKRLSAAM